MHRIDSFPIFLSIRFFFIVYACSLISLLVEENIMQGTKRCYLLSYVEIVIISFLLYSSSGLSKIIIILTNSLSFEI